MKVFTLVAVLAALLPQSGPSGATIVTAGNSSINAKEVTLTGTGKDIEVHYIDLAGKEGTLQAADVVEIVLNGGRAGATSKPAPDDIEITLTSGDVLFGKVGAKSEEGVQLISPAFSDPLVKFGQIRALVFTANRANLPLRLPDKADAVDIIFTQTGDRAEGTVLSIFQTLDQNNLGLESALREINAFVESAGNTNLRQAWQRVELHLDPLSPQGGAPNTPAGDSRALTSGSAAAVSASPATLASVVPGKRDAISGNLQEAYRTEVREALIDAMLDHSSALRLAEADWLTVAARGTEDRPRLNPGDYESPIVQISVRGSDLTAFQAKQISREDARKRFRVKLF